MKDNKEIQISFLIAVIFYILIESFFNMIVNTNAHIFMNLSEFLIIIPTLLIIVSLVVFEIIAFASKWIEDKFRLYFLIYIIIGLRISSQFIINPAVMKRTDIKITNSLFKFIILLIKLFFSFIF